MKKQMILWTCMLLLVLAGCKKDDVQYTDRYELKGCLLYTSDAADE